MTEPKITKRRALLVGLPVMAAVVLGGAGIANAATSTPDQTSSSQSADEKPDSGASEAPEAKPSYTSSVQTTAKDEAAKGAGEAAEDLALAGLAKVDIGAAAKAGEAAVAGGKAIEVELENEGGNVVYTVEVVTQNEKTDVIVDAGNASVLAKSVDHEDGD